MIRPPEQLNVGPTERDPERLERVYQLGRKEALSRLEEMQAFLAGKG